MAGDQKLEDCFDRTVKVLCESLVDENLDYLHVTQGLILDSTFPNDFEPEH